MWGDSDLCVALRLLKGMVELTLPSIYAHYSHDLIYAHYVV